MNTFDLAELEALLCGYWLSDLANFSAYTYETLGDINWAGFYLSDSRALRLGPFMGRPACLEIAFGKGVCGAAFAKRASLLVDDVDQFPSHIRCDLRSRSELVIPLILNDEILGVLDLDSPTVARFKPEDQVLLEKAVEILTKKLETTGRSQFGVI